MNEHYTMVIQWSEEDQVYLVILPEWADHLFGPVTHGKTYEEAVKNGQEALKLLVETHQAQGWPLPAPKVYAETA